MFNDPIPIKNRRLTSWEQQEEKELSKIFMRPERKFLLDMPYYPWLPKNPQEFLSQYYKVNFELNFQE